MGEHLSDDEALTQYARFNDFRREPRAKDRGEISVLRGIWGVKEAAEMVRRQSVDEDDGVRYTTVARLKEAGFSVRATPTRRNPRHGSVEYSGPWDEDTCNRFDACWDMELPKEQPNG